MSKFYIFIRLLILVIIKGWIHLRPHETALLQNLTQDMLLLQF